MMWTFPTNDATGRHNRQRQLLPTFNPEYEGLQTYKPRLLGGTIHNPPRLQQLSEPKMRPCEEGPSSGTLPLLYP